MDAPGRTRDEEQAVRVGVVEVERQAWYGDPLARSRTDARLWSEVPLRAATDPPLYKKMAPEGARLCALGLSDHAIAVRF